MANENNRHHSEAQSLPFRLMLMAPAEVENSSNRAGVATTYGICFRGKRQEICYVYDSMKLNIYWK